MKHTIRLDGGKTAVVMPGLENTARLEITILGVGVGALNLTPDQCGAVIFALEQVLERNGIKQAREQGA